jgi:hypothetical protein
MTRLSIKSTDGKTLVANYRLYYKNFNNKKFKSHKKLNKILDYHNPFFIYKTLKTFQVRLAASAFSRPTIALVFVFMVE